MKRFKQDRTGPDAPAEASKSAEIEAVLASASIITSAEGTQDALNKILGGATRLLKGQEGSVMLCDEHNHLTIRASIGLSDEIVANTRVAAGEGVAGRVLQSGKPLLLTDSPQERSFESFVDTGRPISSAVSVPMISGGNAIGVLNINRTSAGAETLTLEELRTAEIFATLATAALQKTAILEESRRANENLSALVRASRDLVGELETEPLLTRILSNVIALSRGRAGLAALFDQPKGGVTVAVYQGLDRDAVRSALARRGVTDFFARKAAAVISPLDAPALEGLNEPGEEFLILPVDCDSSTKGLVITTGHRPDPASFNLCETYALQAGLAIHNARLSTTVGDKETQLTSIMNSMPNPVIVADLNGNLMEANPAAEQLFGISAQFSKGEPVAGLLGETAIEGYLTGKGPSTAEVQTARPEPRLWKIRASDLHSGPGGRILVMDDVTAERESEGLKADFVAVVGHELRTPLTLIQGYVRTLIKRGEELSAAQKAEALSTVDVQAQRLHRLIEDLLYVSNIEKARPSLALRQVDLPKVVESLVEEFRLRHPARPFNVEAPDSLLMMLDETKIEQVLFHLLDNACKYSEEDAPVSVTVRDSTEMTTIEVKDKGVGILSGDIPSLFDRFHQVDSTSTRKVGGTGVGLYVSKSLVEAHGGKIDVESSWGKGSTFRIRIPKGESGRSIPIAAG